MQLDPETGLDPPGIRMRAAQGLDAADYLWPGFWVWARIISNLAAIGYDSNTMHLAAYDWRLGFEKQETRDHYYSKLKTNIEMAYQQTGRRVVVVCHSMGSLIFFYFLNWVSLKAGEDWADKYLHRFVNIAGPMLGLPKAASSFLSGEMRDTAQLNRFGSFIVDQFLDRKERSDLFRTWVGSASMLMKGGETFWGDLDTPAPDESEVECDSGSCEGKRSGSVLNINFVNRDASPIPIPGISSNSNTFNSSFASLQLNATSSLSLLLAVSGQHFPRHVNTEYSMGISTTLSQFRAARKDPRKWNNPLEVALPRFNSDFKIVCMYGTGIPTERGYWYSAIRKETKGGWNDLGLDNETDFYIDTDINDDTKRVKSGVLLSDGDGTVPILSLGYMCSHGWKEERYNPSLVKTVIREHLHKTSSILNVRGGPSTADHVDVMGNYNLIEDILRIAAGKDDEMEDIIFSRIREIGDKIKLPKL